MQKSEEFLMDLLSPREKEIFLLKKEKYTNRQIANKLGIHRGTVTVYVARIEKKWLTANGQINEKYGIIKTKRKIK